MTPRVLILHGLYGNTADHWQTIFYNNLKKQGIAAAYPELPRKDTPVLTEWLEVFSDLLESFVPDVLVCHSLGVLLTLHALHLNPDLRFRTMIFVAPPAFAHPFDAARTFFPVPECSVRDRAAKSMLVCSDDDPWCPLEESRRMESCLGITTRRFPDRGHINPETGFGPWPDLMEWILSPV